MTNEIVVSKNYNNSSYLIKRLFFNHMRPYLGIVGIAVVCMILVATTTAGTAYIMEPIMDDIFLKKDETMLKVISLTVLLIFLVKGVSMFGQNYLMQCLGQRIITDMQMALFRHLLCLDLSQVTVESSGKIISRFTNDINILRQSVVIILTGMARETLTLVMLVGLMFYQNASLALIAFFAFPVAVYPVIRLGKRMRKISNNTQEEMGEFTHRLDETFRSAKVIKAYRQEEYEISRATDAVERIYALYKKAARNQSAASPIVETIGGFAIAAVIFYGGMQAIESNATSGNFMSFITAALLTYRPAKVLSKMNTNLQDGLAAARRLFILLDTEPQIKDSANAKTLKITKKGASVEFKDVKFSYTEEKPALKGVSIQANAGETIALVGPSGGGKSTIMSLILRFYDVNEGAIKINGNDIKDFTISSLRDNISYVSQEISLFDDSVAANIAYGNPTVSMKKIEEVAKAAAAHDFISKLPDGYHTLIGQDGTRLSGGQRQRISIARAMLKGSPILLLDEATSALDKISENKIQAAIEKLMKGKTTIVIAHRLSTIENADKIYVIKQGEVVEEGKHSTLIRKEGEYKKLYKGIEKDNEAGKENT
ncbi:MAG: ABC transporter permease [Alphaproteobacteria bacterium CG11_big_fil_rev_8_21_14_0_20_39_49]|nr:MAG: ABC transporter permease [Alphaproteobacteria bacterium CG11_big_fil_rev_8_21_14_0_20_39_49]